MEKVDILFINPGNRQETYQDFGDEFRGMEPPACSGLFATFLIGQGCSVAIIDAPLKAGTALESA